jgi:hypothetical protein
VSDKWEIGPKKAQKAQKIAAKLSGNNHGRVASLPCPDVVSITRPDRNLAPLKVYRCGGCNEFKELDILG